MVFAHPLAESAAAARNARTKVFAIMGASAGWIRRFNHTQGVLFPSGTRLRNGSGAVAIGGDDTITADIHAER
jgi:hypothetical protein